MPGCARLSLDGLVHATLIAYPVYRDQLTGLAATPEQIVGKLAAGGPATGAPGMLLLRLLRKFRLRTGSV